MYYKMKNFQGPEENKFMSRFYQALNSSIPIRCNELSLLFDRAQPKDLQTIYPTLINNIFGTPSTPGWGLRTITSESNPRDFKIIVDFLNPFGPVFRLIYKLLGESSHKYDYNLDQLPMKIRTNLENGHIPPFYNDILCFDMQMKQLVCLKLNPFDYYIFNFAWHLISPWQQRNMIASTWNTWDTVYYMLCCNYLIHFLPSDPNNPIPLPHVPSHFTGKNPVVKHLQVPNRNPRVSKLFLPQVLHLAALETNALQQNCQQHPRGEIWRSETVLQVMIDLWLNFDQFNNQTTYTLPKQSMNELPTAEYVRIIRSLVKQLHAFIASGKTDLSPMSELKKIALPMFQGKMYAFLRHLIHRWPLDGSFRLVLELWFSFIQPWRYTGDYAAFQKNLKDSSDVNNQNPKVDREYLKFMADNLLAYTIIFQQLLPRFLRIDLSSPKNAVMIFRVTKVFSQPNLVPMLQEIEGCIDNRNHSPSHSYNNGWTSTLPPLSPTSNWSTNTPNGNMSQMNSSSVNYYQDNSFKKTYNNDTFGNDSIHQTTPTKTNKWTAIVRQQIFELEGHDFFYKPMFTSPPASEVLQLAYALEQAATAVKLAINSKQEKMNEERKGFIGLIKYWFNLDFENNDEFTLEERKNVPVYLDLALEYLKRIFNLNLNQNHRTQSIQEEMDTDHSFTSPLNASLNMSLTPTEVRKRASTVCYEGDPDLLPVGSRECGFLVTILYLTAQKINENFGNQMISLYHRTDFWGRIARQIIHPPRLIFVYEKSQHGGVSPRRERLLLPRLSFRTFASYKMISYIIFGFIFGSLMGFKFFTIAFFMFLLFSLVIVIKALLSKENRFVNVNNTTNMNNTSFR